MDSAAHRIRRSRAAATAAVARSGRPEHARKRDAAGCMRAFHDNHYFGFVVLAGIIVEYASRR